MEGKRPLSTSATATAGPSTAEPILLGTQHDQDESTNGSSTAASSPPTTPGTPPPTPLQQQGGTPMTPNSGSSSGGEGTPMEVGGLRSMSSSPLSSPSTPVLGVQTGLLGTATNLSASSSSTNPVGLIVSGVPSPQQTSKKVELEIAPTTGGSFTFVIDPNESIEGLKKAIGKRLKVGKEHICLLHRDRLLESSKRIRDYGLADGSRVSLVPSVETGLLTQRPEQSVLEALEGLNETQVGDFLSGKSPLNLTMRLGDHVMLIQLQLSKGNKTGSSASSSSSATALAAAATAAAAAASASTTPTAVPSTSTSTSSSSSSHHNPSSHSSTFGQSESRPTSSSATQTTLPSTSTPQATPVTPATASSSTSSYEFDRLNTLAEASRNLSNTLKKLSSHVIKEDDDSITNHMQHHGKGVYSGTFSGTLNPALQDGLGKPKKHVSTIIHILNDLLGGMDPGKCTHIATSTSSGAGISSGSLSTDLHNKRRQLRRRQPEHHHHHRKSDSQGSSSSSYNPSIPGSPQDTMKKSKLTPEHHFVSATATSSSGCETICGDGGDHHYHRCRNSDAPQASSAVSRERENEQLRLKMERIKESLRLRKEKMLLRNRGGGSGAGTNNSSGTAPATTTTPS